MSDVLAALERELSDLPPDAIAEIDGLLQAELAKPWLPQPGPQTVALTSTADLLLYGGAAGGGKSELLLGLALTEHERSVIFRAHYPDLAFLEERSIEIIGSRDGYNGETGWHLPGHRLEFGALGKPGAEKGWQGRPHDFIGVDEGAQLPAEKVRYVLGWNRSTTPGRKCRAIISSNPPDHGEGEWLIEWFAPWLDPLFPKPALPGELRWCVTSSNGTTIWVDGPGTFQPEDEKEPLIAESRTFVPAKLEDNAYLKDTNYRARIMAFPEPRRSQLLHGDFLAARQDHEWQVIPSDWVRAAQERWKKGKPEPGRMIALGVDVAQGGPDDTVLAPLYGTWFDELKKHKGIDTKNGPQVAALIIRERRDGAAVNIDLTGGWGGSARDHLVANKIPCNGIVFSAGSKSIDRSGRFGFVNMRAELWMRFREALDPETGDDVGLPPDKRLFAQLTAPRYRLVGNKYQVEMKEDVKKRLGGASTDDADAVILAWHDRSAVAIRRHRKKHRTGSWQSA